LDLVKCDWFTVLDADDAMEADRIERLTELAAENFDLLADDMWVVEEGASESDRTPLIGLTADTPPSTLEITEFILGNLPQKNGQQKELGFIKPLIKTSLLKSLNLKYDESMRLGEDYDLYVRLMASGARAGLAPAQGYIAYRRSDSLSRVHGHKELERLYKSAKAHQKLTGLSADTKAAMAKLRTHLSGKYRWAKLIDDLKQRNVSSALLCFATSPKNILLLLGNSIGLSLDKVLKRPKT
jgi:succinoglycan biosynthesis protein ExoU